MEEKQSFETNYRDNLGPVTRAICHLRQYCMIYVLQRHQLHLDLFVPEIPILNQETTQILVSVLEIISSWLSCKSLAAQILQGAYRFQVKHAINSLFLIVVKCCEDRNCPTTGARDHPIIRQYNLLYYCNEIIGRCSKDPDAMKELGNKWNKICTHLGERHISLRS